jgi:uncharacterized membrane protein
LVQECIIYTEGHQTVLKRALGKDLKGKLSPWLYLAGIVSAFYVHGLSLLFYFIVAMMWLVPDKRIERELRPHPDDHPQNPNV